VQRERGGKEPEGIQIEEHEFRGGKKNCNDFGWSTKWVNTGQERVAEKPYCNDTLELNCVLRGKGQKKRINRNEGQSLTHL